MNSKAREELKRKLSRHIEKKGGDLKAYKEVMDIIWRYLRHILGQMTSNLVMERCIRLARERFPDIQICMTDSGPEIKDIQASEQAVDVLKFCMENVIEFMEKLAGDTLLKGLMRRLDTKKRSDEI